MPTPAQMWSRIVTADSGRAEPTCSTRLSSLAALSRRIRADFCAYSACFSALNCAVLCASSLLGASAHAALFEDAEARRAILEMRQRVDAMQQNNQRSTERSGDDVAQMRRSLLDLQTQIQSLQSEQARLRGQNEQLQKDVSDLQQRMKDG